MNETDVRWRLALAARQFDLVAWQIDKWFPGDPSPNAQAEIREWANDCRAVAGETAVEAVEQLMRVAAPEGGER